METAFVNLPADAQRAKVAETARRLVDNEVCYCVSALYAVLVRREWDGSDGIDPDDLARLVSRDPDADDYREAAEEAVQDGELLTVDELATGGFRWRLVDADGNEEIGGEVHKDAATAWRAGFDNIGADHPDGQETLEHWLVSDWLAEQLEAKGEAVARDVAGLTIWGRCTSGQMIAADHVIEQIARDLLAA